MPSYAELLQGFNPLAQFKAGQQYVTDNADQQAQMQAGQQYAQGNRAGAASTLAGRGDIRSAMMLNNEQRQATQDQHAQAQQEQAQKAKFLLQGVQSLRQVPEAQRNDAFQHLVPALQAMGMDPDTIDRLAQAPKTNDALDSFATALGQPRDKATVMKVGEREVVGIDPYNNEVTPLYTAAPDPQKMEQAAADLAKTKAETEYYGSGVKLRGAQVVKAMRPPAAKSENATPPWVKFGGKH